LKFWLLIFLVQICSPSVALTEYDKAEATLGKQYQTRKNFENKINAQVNEPYEAFKKNWQSSANHTYSEGRAAIQTLSQIVASGEAIKKQISVELGSAGQRQIENIDGVLAPSRDVLSLLQDTVRNGPSSVSVSSGGSDARYTVDKDYGTAASFEWFKRKVVVRCEGGQKNGDLPSVFLENSGRWSTTYVGGKFDSLHAAAMAACK
jgi:hypothetical protein